MRTLVSNTFIFKKKKPKKLTNKSFISITQSPQFITGATTESTGVEPIYQPTCCYWLDWDIRDNLDDLNDELSNIINKLTIDLYTIKQNVFIRDLTIYNENLQYLEDLAILDTIEIDNIYYLKIGGHDNDGDCIEFVNMETGYTIGHYSKLAPYYYRLKPISIPVEIKLTRLKKIIIFMKNIYQTLYRMCRHEK